MRLLKSQFNFEKSHIAIKCIKDDWIRNKHSQYFYHRLEYCLKTYANVFPVAVCIFFFTFFKLTEVDFMIFTEFINSIFRFQSRIIVKMALIYVTGPESDISKKYLKHLKSCKFSCHSRIFCEKMRLEIFVDEMRSDHYRYFELARASFAFDKNF